MRARYIVLLVATVIFTGCRGGLHRGAQPVLALKGDSGYVCKRDALPFLLATGLTDTIKDYWKEQFANDGDTIGKYFPANTPGNKVLLVRLLCAADSFECNMLMEVDAKGRLLAHEPYPTDDRWCYTDAAHSFRKEGKYFIIEQCGHGSGYGSKFVYAVDRVTPADSTSAVHLSNYSTFGSIQSVASEMKLSGDSMKVTYTIESGYYSEEADSDIWDKKRVEQVMYTRRGDRWTTADSSKIADMEDQ